jgi:hypothetical protein
MPPTSRIKLLLFGAYSIKRGLGGHGPFLMVKTVESRVVIAEAANLLYSKTLDGISIRNLLQSVSENHNVIISALHHLGEKC